MGHGFLHICRYRTHHDTKEIIMSPAKRYAKKQAKASQRRRRHAQERLDRDRRQAQQAAEALHQALEELGLPDTLGSEIEGRLESQQKLLGKIGCSRALMGSCWWWSLGMAHWWCRSTLLFGGPTPSVRAHRAGTN